MITQGNIYKVILKGQAYGIVDSSNLAPVEETQYASQDYTSGKYLIFNGVLCITTDDITAGDTLVIGTSGNLVAVQISSEMLSLKNQIEQGLEAVNQRIDDYRIPVADANTVGGVKIGSGINRASDGKISVPPYSLPTASAGTKGGVTIGSGSDVGLLMNGTNLMLRTASSSYKGGIRVDGNNMRMSDGYIKLGRIQYSEATFSLTSSNQWNIDANQMSEKEFTLYSSINTRNLVTALYEGRGCIYGVETNLVTAVSIENITYIYSDRFNIRLAMNNSSNSNITITSFRLRYWYLPA